jgi:hypothetical protein
MLEGAMIKPITAITSPRVMCQVRSCRRPELQPTMMPAAPARRNGGHVMTSVMVVLKPRVFTTVGKKPALVSEALSTSMDGVRRRGPDRGFSGHLSLTVEAARGQVSHLHERKQPTTRVSRCLLESVESSGLERARYNYVPFHSCMSEFTLFR